MNVGDEVLLLMLQRVHDGHITEYCGFYFVEGQRVSWHSVECGFQTVAEVGRLELTYPPDSGVGRAKDYGPGAGERRALHPARGELAELGRRGPQNSRSGASPGGWSRSDSG